MIYYILTQKLSQYPIYVYFLSIDKPDANKVLKKYSNSYHKAHTFSNYLLSQLIAITYSENLLQTVILCIGLYGSFAFC